MFNRDRRFFINQILAALPPAVATIVFLSAAIYLHDTTSAVLVFIACISASWSLSSYFYIPKDRRSIRNKPRFNQGILERFNFAAPLLIAMFLSGWGASMNGETLPKAVLLVVCIGSLLALFSRVCQGITPESLNEGSEFEDDHAKLRRKFFNKNKENQ